MSRSEGWCNKRRNIANRCWFSRRGARGRRRHWCRRPYGTPSRKPTRRSRGRHRGLNCARGICERRGRDTGRCSLQVVARRVMAGTLNSLGRVGLGRRSSRQRNSPFPMTQLDEQHLPVLERLMDAVTVHKPSSASGGIVQPGDDIDAAITLWATPDGPIREGLPSFEADTRRYSLYPNGRHRRRETAMGIWTEATDAEPAGATKPVKAMVCGEEVECLSRPS